MLNSSPIRASPLYAQRAGRDVRLLVVTRFIRLHPGAQKGNAANYWSLFEPHYKQNLSANPKRTAKSSFYISDASHLTFVQIIFTNRKIFSQRAVTRFPSQLTVYLHRHRSHEKVAPSRDASISSKKNRSFFANAAFMQREFSWVHQPSREWTLRGLSCCIMRAIWKGSISFSLINIPIALYPATRREELKFRLLRVSDLSPVNYKRVAEADGKEVPWDHIVKGYEYEKGKFIVLKDEDFKRADIEATQSVDILDFVDLEDIDPIYFDKPYYLEPEKRGEKAYGLLREALKQSSKVGIAKVVIKTRQHLASVKPEKNLLVLELMHFKEEIIETAELKIPANPHIGVKELAMAKDLISKMSGEWDPAKYQDEYRQALMEVIHKKVESGGKELPTRGKTKKPTNVVDLVSVLQESLQHAKKETVGKRKPATHKRKLRKAA